MTEKSGRDNKYMLKIIKNLWWNINFESSLFLGFSFLGIGRIAATKTLLISRAMKVSKRNALELYLENQEKFDKSFGAIDLEGLVTVKEMNRVQNELNTINTEDL